MNLYLVAVEKNEDLRRFLVQAESEDAAFSLVELEGWAKDWISVATKLLGEVPKDFAVICELDD